MTSSYDSNLSGAGSSLANTIVAVIIFIIVSFTFLFPLNRIITLDRRSVSVLGATLCYAARLFTNNGMDILNSIDFDVLVLLASIMVIIFNYHLFFKIPLLVNIKYFILIPFFPYIGN